MNNLTHCLILFFRVFVYLCICFSAEHETWIIWRSEQKAQKMKVGRKSEKNTAVKKKNIFHGFFFSKGRLMSCFSFHFLNVVHYVFTVHIFTFMLFISHSLWQQTSTSYIQTCSSVRRVKNLWVNKEINKINIIKRALWCWGWCKSHVARYGHKYALHVKIISSLSRF